MNLFNTPNKNIVKDSKKNYDIEKMTKKLSSKKLKFYFGLGREKKKLILRPGEATNWGLILLKRRN